MEKKKMPQPEPNKGSGPVSDDSLNRGDKDTRKNTGAEFDKLAEEANKNRTRKPGSQSNSNTSRNNNGRGGGK